MAEPFVPEVVSGRETEAVPVGFGNLVRGAGDLPWREGFVALALCSSEAPFNQTRRSELQRREG